VLLTPEKHMAAKAARVLTCWRLEDRLNLTCPVIKPGQTED